MRKRVMALPGANSDSASSSISTSTATSTWEISRHRSRPGKSFSGGSGAGGARVRGRPRLWPLIVLLLLSQSVWNTLQCTTRTAQPEIPNSFQGDFETSTRIGSGSENELEVDDNYFRPRRNGLKPVCKYRLLDAVLKTCRDNGLEVYEPGQGQGELQGQHQSSHSKRSLMQQRLLRLPRSVVNECCNKPCNQSTLIKYCQKKSQTTQKETELDTEVARTMSIDAFQPQVPQQVAVAPSDQIAGVLAHQQQRPESEESGEPMLYYPLLKIINLIHRQFEENNKKTEPFFLDDIQLQEDQQPLPQQLIQVNHGQGHTHGHGHTPRFSNNGESLTSASANSGAMGVSASNLHNRHHNNGNGVPETGSGHHHSHHNHLSDNQNSQFPFRAILQAPGQGQGQRHDQRHGQGQGSSEGSRRPTGTAQNAITASEPSYIFSILPGTNDYI